ncbi:hypothetical protein BGZ70_004349 [Mortierella alpina]|uniref:Uncharacterized protein n=1 Tax=Mortierella alpina TaxID=64518 RepID=A0A9P6LV88_MORAP|nr:hypothetical protein BGZ70_004349 [Mortierella alpina]
MRIFRFCSKISLVSRKRHLLVLAALLIQILIIVTLYVEPLYFISRPKLDITGTLENRLSVVVASNRRANIQTLLERTDFGFITPYSLENLGIDLSKIQDSEQTIKTLYLEALKLCDKHDPGGRHSVPVEGREGGAL